MLESILISSMSNRILIKSDLVFEKLRHTIKLSWGGGGGGDSLTTNKTTLIFIEIHPKQLWRVH